VLLLTTVKELYLPGVKLADLTKSSYVHPLFEVETKNTGLKIGLINYYYWLFQKTLLIGFIHGLMRIEGVYEFVPKGT
jgi:hypothetical protein